jgi:hypothetical protein
MEYNREDPAITFSCEEYGRKQSGNIWGSIFNFIKDWKVASFQEVVSLIVSQIR